MELKSFHKSIIERLEADKRRVANTPERWKTLLSKGREWGYWEKMSRFRPDPLEYAFKIKAMDKELLDLVEVMKVRKKHVLLAMNYKSQSMLGFVLKRYSEYETPSVDLLKMIMKESIETMFAEILEEIKFNPNKKDKDGRTLGHYAVVELKSMVVKKLVDLGADLNVRDNEGITPLMLGARIIPERDMEKYLYLLHELYNRGLELEDELIYTLRDKIDQRDLDFAMALGLPIY